MRKKYLLILVGFFITACGSSSYRGEGNINAGYILGADISSAAEMVDKGAVFIDTDGVQKPLLALLKNHGFNYIRLRTFVEPSALYGYASASSCHGKAQSYNDMAHIVKFSQQVKAMGMGVLLDFHYSDTWADPQKQVIPESWRHIASIEDMAAQVNQYTIEVMTALAEADALPEMVQIGNEITPGMLLHIPTQETDCFGNNSVLNTPVNGSTSNWDNLSLLLKAGVSGVKEVSPGSKIMLHIENTEDLPGIINWVESAKDRGVEFDVLGLSAYEKWQGPSSEWRSTIQSLQMRFNDLSFSIVEYNPQRRMVNDIIHDLPGERGVGTFIWEPIISGEWGDALFTQEGNIYKALDEGFEEYDELVVDYELPN